MYTLNINKFNLTRCIMKFQRMCMNICTEERVEVIYSSVNIISLPFFILENFCINSTRVSGMLIHTVKIWHSEISQ
jgi:hypothetical protein